MNDELRTLWKEANESMSDKGTWDANHHRKKTSDKISKRLRIGITLDIIIKSLIAMAAFLLLIFSGFAPSYVLLTVISLFLLLLMIATGIVSKKKLNAIATDLPVLKRLEQNLEFMETTYRQFMFSNALTAPMFVFTGNCYYFHFKYGEMRFDDPVVLIFIALSFLIAFAAQYPIYHLQIRELEASIGDLDEIKAKAIDKAKSKQKRIYSLWILAGIVVFIIMLAMLFIIV